MSNPLALSKGLGSIMAVAGHYAQESLADGTGTAAIDELAAVLSPSVHDSAFGIAANAIIAAWYNRRFQATGRLYTVGKDGEVSVEYFSPGGAREAIGIMMAD